MLGKCYADYIACFFQIEKKQSILHIKLRFSSLQQFAISELWCIMQFFIFLHHAIILGDPEVTANLYCNFADLYREGCVIYSIYLR